jgi:hypothetical protein
MQFEVHYENSVGRLLRQVGFIQPRSDSGGVFEAHTWGRVAIDPVGMRARSAGKYMSIFARRLQDDVEGLLIMDVDSSVTSLCLSERSNALCMDTSAGGEVGAIGVALPERVLARPGLSLRARHRNGEWSAARVRVGSECAPPANTDGVSVVLTSSGRPDLLQRTLDSFFRFNTYPIAQFIVVEDGPRPACQRQMQQRYSSQKIKWLATGRRTGQIGAIDYAYSFVDTPYVFHMEEDWEFYASGFIERSLKLLQADQRCLQIWLRAHNDTNLHPLNPMVEIVDGIAFKRLQLRYLRVWSGFSFNPGLRRMADYLTLGCYSWHTSIVAGDPNGPESQLSQIYHDAGFYAAILDGKDGAGYVRHIGFARRVPATSI